MGDITQNLIQTIAMVAEHAVSTAHFDRTIQAVIMSCEDQARGIYKVKYQDSIWLAYSIDLKTVYTSGTSVYILIPGNDMSRNKTIIGSVNKLGQNYVDYISNEDNFVEEGSNIVNMTPATREYSLCSYNSPLSADLMTLYPDSFAIDQIAASEYLKKSTYVMLKADFRTELPMEQRKAGNYGLQVQMQFNNSKEGELPIKRVYILDIDSMVGNPYLFIAPLTQKVYFEIDGENFRRISSVKFFVKDFEHHQNGHPADVFVSNIEIVGANTISQQEREGLSLRFRSPKGYIFTLSDINTDTKTIIAQIRVSNKLLSSTKNIPFYWFKRDSTITASSDKYSKYGGKGWRCLNTANEDQNVDIKFLSATDTFSITKAEMLASRATFKCVAIYEGKELSRTFQIVNMDSEYTIEVISDQEPVFYPNMNSLRLTCIVKRRQEVVQSGAVIYHWNMITENNTYQTLASGTNDNIRIQAQSIRNFNDYYCTVYAQGDLLGTAALRVTRNSEPQNRYILSIVNGVQVFNYDEFGDSPYEKHLENSLTIPQLSFTVTDVITGLDVTNQVKNITWIFPIKNTLLTDQNEIENSSSGEGSEYQEYTNLQNFSYGIAKTYRAQATNNNIKLRLLIHGITLQATTSLTFTKEGNSGTNGTGIVCKIVATKNGQRVSGWLIGKATNNGTSNSLSYNWDDMKVQLWQNGQTIFSSRNTQGENNDKKIVTWEFLNNQDNTLWYTIPKNSQTGESSNARVAIFDTTNSLTINSTTFNAASGFSANILKVTVQYDNRKYYDSRPIVTIFNKEQNLITLENSGFQYVTYSEDGENPSYDNTSPFSIVQGNEIHENTAWTVIGSIRVKSFGQNAFSQLGVNSLNLGADASKNSQENITNYSGDKNYFKPKTTYDGLCVTNAILAKGTTFWVHIPIHFMYNRYGHKELNDWDGNRLQIDDNGNFILAPQIGAGIKDNNNAFTGLVMGTSKIVKNDGYETQIGLFGYNAGERTLFLDSKTGKAEFGRQGTGRIVIDPTAVREGEPQALIYGGVYQEKSLFNEGSGMLINLTAPQIKFGTGNFSVNSAGNLTAKTGKIGPWHLTETSLYYSENEISGATLGTISSNEDYMYLGYRGLSLGPNFIYNSQTGQINLSVASLSIEGRTPEEIAQGKLQDWVRETYETDKQTLQSQIDGKIQTYHQDNDPSTDWTTAAQKLIHKGDLWYCTQNSTSGDIFVDGTASSNSYAKNQTYRWDGTKWIKENAPDEVFDAIDGKAQIFITTPVPPYDIGDLWLNDNASEIKICTIARSSGGYISTDWEKRDKYTDDTRANAAYTLAETAGTTATNYIFNKLTKNTGESDNVLGMYISQNKITNSNLSSRSGGNIRLSSDGMHIYNGTKELVHYGATTNFYSYATSSTSNPTTAATLGADGLTITKGIISLGSLDNTTGIPSQGKSGIYINSNGRMFLGNSTNYIRWNGTSLTLQGNYNQTGGYISLGSLTSPGSTPASNTSGFRVNSDGLFTVGDSSNYIAWNTSNGLRMKMDTFVCDVSGNDQVRITNGKMFFSYDGINTGFIGAHYFTSIFGTKATHLKIQVRSNGRFTLCYGDNDSTFSGAAMYYQPNTFPISGAYTQAGIHFCVPVYMHGNLNT